MKSISLALVLAAACGQAHTHTFVRTDAKFEPQQKAAEAARVGAQSGCDVLLERDVFDLGHRLTRLNETGPIWIWEDAKEWQFICGVKGASAEEAHHSLLVAVNRAQDIRDDIRGPMCEPKHDSLYGTLLVQTGSHVIRRSTCVPPPAER